MIMAKQATNILLFGLKQIPHPRANLQKANVRPWEQIQLTMPDKCSGEVGEPMELIETLHCDRLNIFILLLTKDMSN